MTTQNPKSKNNPNLDKSALSDHIAVAKRLLGIGGFTSILPNPDVVLKRLGMRSISVYRELLIDPIVGGAVRRRKSAVKRLEYRLEQVLDTEMSGEMSDKQQAIIKAMLANIDLYELIGQILDATLYGYQPIEIIWELKDSYWTPVKLTAKPQEWFGFDDDSNLVLIDGVIKRQLPAYKFLCPTHEATYTNPYGTAELSSVYWACVFKRGGLKFWAEFAEKFGSPWIIGHEPRSNTDADTSKLLDALEDLMGNAVATIPNDSSVEIKEVTGKTGSSQVFDDFIRYCKSEINIALLGQDQTTDKDTNHASAQSGLSVTKDIRDNDCRIVEKCINTLLAWICELNFHNTTPPKFVLYEEEVGDDTLATRDQKLNSMGVVFAKAYYARAYNLADDEFELGQMSERAEPSQTPTNRTANFSEKSFAPQGDLADKLAIGLPSDDELTAQVMQMLDDFTSLDNVNLDSETALLEELASLYPKMNIDDLQDKLNQMLFIADTLSRLQTQEEMGLN
ncbi:DUF935 domain-containing protein [Moraxella catarrhalis]|uniref:DUF935 domain-containing protein n=1 Tax=Moraxella catarrhalis TaxID=480 RepID=UPI00128D4AF5|nr:DUF935 family protein [Moraxella catarrhalis]MPY07381.1 DUF935 family protein [Moraxella catarrhalis]